MMELMQLVWHPLQNIEAEQIKSVPHAKYLSVVIDKHLSFNEHIKMITNKLKLTLLSNFCKGILAHVLKR